MNTRQRAISSTSDHAGVVSSGAFVPVAPHAQTGVRPAAPRAAPRKDALVPARTPSVDPHWVITGAIGIITGVIGMLFALLVLAIAF